MAMFNAKREGSGVATVIAEGVKVEGNFTGDGPMVIDGSVVGVINTNESVEIGQAAHIDANIRASTVVVGGHVKGNIVARERLELLAGSRVDGDVNTKSLIIAEGAMLNGKCSMDNEKPSRTSKAQATPPAIEEPVA